MDRSLFPDGVIVESSDLLNTEVSKAYHIQQRQQDMAQHGRVSGLALTTGSSAFTFNISAGRGYTPRGDLIVVSAPLTDQTMVGGPLRLGSTSDTAENIVCLHYREETSQLAPHETSGQSVPKRISGTYAVVVLTVAAYNALPETVSAIGLRDSLENTDYSARLSKDTLLVLGVGTVVGSFIVFDYVQAGSPLPIDATARFYYNGYFWGVQTPSSAPGTTLTAEQGSIVSPSSFTTATPSAATPPTDLGTTIPGINLRGIVPSSSTPTVRPILGRGYLVLARGPSTTLQWTSPTGVSSVAATLTPSLASEQVTLATAQGDLLVEVIFSLLPASTGFYSQYVIIEPLYEKAGQIFSVRDEAHRESKGSYAQSATNPHGIGFKDLEQNVAILNQPLVLGPERLDTEAQALIPRITTSVSTAVSADRTLLWLMDKGTYSIRFYRTSTAALEIVSNASWNGTQWVADSTANAAVRWVFSSSGLTVQSTSGNASATFADNLFLTQWVNNSISGPLLSLGTEFTPASRARVSMPTSLAGLQLLVDRSSSNPASVPSTRVYGIGSNYTTFTVNQSTSDGLTWTKDRASEAAFRLQIDTSISATGWQIVYNAPNASTDQTLVSGNLTTGVVTIPGGVELGSGQTLATTPRLVYTPFTYVTTGTWRRVLLETVPTSGMTGVGTLRRYVAVGPDDASYSEEAFNCIWNGSASWSKETSGSQALLIRKGINGTTTLFRAASSNISWDDGGWSTQSYPNAIPKAWAHLRRRLVLNNTSPTGQWVLTGSANIASISYVNYAGTVLGPPTYSGSPASVQYAQGRGLRLTFINPFPDRNYAAFVNIFNPSSRVSRNFRASSNDLNEAQVVLRQLHNMPINPVENYIDIYCRTFMSISDNPNSRATVVALRDICASGIVTGNFTEYQDGTGASLTDTGITQPNAAEDILYQSADNQIGLSVVIYSND